MEAKKIVYTYKASLDALEPIRELLTKAGESIGLDKKKTYKLTLAIDEIATNVIKHGYLEEGIDDGEFDVIVEFEESQLVVTLEDSAVPFNPLEHIVPSDDDLSKPLQERPIGGLGVMIARNSVDDWIYEFKNNRNQNIFIVKMD